MAYKPYFMRIKQVPEDFIVTEINTLKVSDKGKYCAFTLEKKGWNTIDAIKEIANRLGIKEKDIRYAGLKDKEAVTRQLITIDLKNPKLIQRLKIKDVSLEFLGMSGRHTETADNQGNKFVITIRDIGHKYAKLSEMIPNYFDEQRFGNNKNNHVVGGLIIKKQFKEACELLNLKAENNDYVGALKNTGVAHIYFSAYQSYLFNLVLSSLIIKASSKVFYVDIAGNALAFPIKAAAIPESLPLVSFDTVFENEEVESEFESLLKQDNITLRDFAIKQFPSLVSSSPSRDSFIKVEDFKISGCKKDELNQGKMKQVIGFSLPRGSYATIVLKSLLNADIS